MTSVKTVNDILNEVLKTQYERLPALRLDSPPGAGKTDVVEKIAVQNKAMLDERCRLVTQTNEQSFDLARRLCLNYPKERFVLFVRNDLSIPAFLKGTSNLQIAHRPSELPTGSCVVIGNAWRWSQTRDITNLHFDCQIVDEAFQLPDYLFHQIAGMADRYVLVGDPGQIQPFIKSDTREWDNDPAGPHLPAPIALTARYPDLRRLSLPISRRLVQDTVSFIRPAFYPRLDFSALSDFSSRKLITPIAGITPFDKGIDKIVEGESLVHLELPVKSVGEIDNELISAILRTIDRLLDRRASIFDDGKNIELTPDMIGVACSHVSQVNAIYRELTPKMSGVFVETANRFQGLERPVMLVYHPLSGRVDADQFHLDAGRLCVMLSRHRVASILFSRAGIEDLLLQHSPVGNRALGSIEDVEFTGWQANLTILESLRDRKRVVTIK